MKNNNCSIQHERDLTVSKVQKIINKRKRITILIAVLLVFLAVGSVVLNRCSVITVEVENVALILIVLLLSALYLFAMRNDTVSCWVNNKVPIGVNEEEFSIYIEYLSELN